MSNITPSSDSSIVEQYRRAVRELEDRLSSETQRIRDKNEKQIDEIEEKKKNWLQKKEEELNQTVDTRQKYSSEAFENERAKHQAAVNELKDQIYNAKGEISRSIPQEAHDRQIAALADESQRRHQQDVRNLESREDELTYRLRKQGENHSDELRRIAGTKNSDVEVLSNQVKDLNNYGRELEHQKAQEMSDYKRELDETTKIEVRNLDDSYKKNLTSLQEEANNRNDYYSQRYSDTLKEKEGNFANIIRNQNTDHHRQIKEETDTYNTKIDQLDKQRIANDRRSQDLLERKTDELNSEHVVTLENQAKAYEDTIARIKNTDEDQINTLQKSLQVQRTTDDTSSISPAAEATLRKQIVREYEKALKTETEKNKMALEESKTKSTENYKKMVEELTAREVVLQQTSANEIAGNRAQFFTSLQESEEASKAKLREQESEHDKERENLYRSFGNVMERQRQDYEHILQVTRSDAESRLDEYRRDTELRERNTQREFSTKHADTVRDYEKKLNELKATSDFKLENLKAENQRTVTEMERQAKQDMESQAKGFEQRIAQIDVQNKERERSIVQNYQDELDKVRRNYELSSQKKS